jgi:hypothetical protein
MNKEISDFQVKILLRKKEKESTKNSVLLLKKHILIISEKIMQEEIKSKQFIHNVSELADKSIKKR